MNNDTDRIDLKKLDLLFTLTGRDKIKTYTLNTENVCRILRGHPEFSGRFRYDLFRNRFEILDFDTNAWRNMEDGDALVVQTRISILFSFFQTVNKNMAYDAMIVVAKEQAVDSALDFLKSLKWDETRRLDTWLTSAYGTPDDAYHRAVGANWIKGLARRIAHPGSKFDYVLVLEGEQGSMKSTSLAILGGEWHLETTKTPDSKDFFMEMQGKVIIEFSEGESLSRTEIKKMKGMITTQVDTFRVPYERAAKDFPRRCVFAMTTNQDEYLKDETGNRRWLPVKVRLPRVNVEWLKENREQLLAEAYHRAVVLKESVHEFPEEETRYQQSERRVSDPNAELVVAWYRDLASGAKSEGITIHMVFKDVYGMSFSSRPITKAEEMGIAGILKDTLKLTKRREMKDGVRCIRWYDENNVSPYSMKNGVMEFEEDF